MKTVIIYILSFIGISLFNSWLTATLDDNVVFTQDLIDPKSIIIRIVIALLITQFVLRILDKRTRT